MPSAKLDSEWIISHSVGIARMELYLRFNELVPLGKISEIRDRIVKRGTRVPLQHILRSVQFCDLELKSDKRALVPRPEDTDGCTFGGLIRSYPLPPNKTLRFFKLRKSINVLLLNNISSYN